MSAPQAAVPSLRLVVRCHAWLLAVGAQGVDRVVSADDLGPPERQESGAAVPGACLGFVTTDSTRYAAWDLGRLLGLEDVQGAWVLTRIPVGDRTVAVALRTGPCVAVAAIDAGAVMPLPPAAFRTARRSALGGAFWLDALGLAERLPGSVGLEIVPSHLLASSELEQAERWLRGEDGPLP